VDILYAPGTSQVIRNFWNLEKMQNAPKQTFAVEQIDNTIVVILGPKSQEWLDQVTKLDDNATNINACIAVISRNAVQLKKLDITCAGR
jgi:hypothetical protein